MKDNFAHLYYPSLKPNLQCFLCDPIPLTSARNLLYCEQIMTEKEYQAAYYLANRDRLVERREQLRRERGCKKRTKFATDEERKEAKKAARPKSNWREWERNWLQKNREKYNAARRRRYKSDPVFRIKNEMRNRTRMELKRVSARKDRFTAEILGCSSAELKLHLESQFAEGMTWTNRTAWHIDHKIPLASAKTAESLWPLLHYTNLQPIWATENLSKCDKLPCGTRAYTLRVA